MSYKDPEVCRAYDRERFARRTAERLAAGLCPKCGQRPPEPERSICAPCAEQARAAGRARDARLRATGQPRRDPERARAYERKRVRRQTADRIARGVCSKCGTNPAEPGRRLCEPCAETRREYDRRRYAKRQSGRPQVRGQEHRFQAPQRPPHHPEAPANSPRVRPMHALRAPSARRGRRDLRAVPAGAPKRWSVNGMPRGEPPTCAPAAAGRRRTAVPGARPAPCSKPSAAGPNARTPGVGNATGNAARPAAARTATSSATERQGASRARNARTSAPISSAASRCGIPALP